MKRLLIQLFPLSLITFSLTTLNTTAQEGQGESKPKVEIKPKLIPDQSDEADKKKELNDNLPTASEEEQKKAWLVSIEEGVKLAKEQNKLVMIEFTGSDWCPPCIMMAKKVFSKTAFLEGAQKDYVLVKIDLPNSDPELKKANSILKDKYKVKGVPTVLLFDAEGKEFSRFVASQHRTVEDFLKKLATSKRRRNML